MICIYFTTKYELFIRHFAYTILTPPIICLRLEAGAKTIAAMAKTIRGYQISTDRVTE